MVSKFEVNTITPKTGTQNGVRLTVNGNGFTSTTKVFYGTGSDLECLILTYTSSVITCLTPTVTNTDVADVFV